MRTTDIVNRILDGGVCPAEIAEHNAGRIVSWIRDTDRHHTADECSDRKGHCVHAPTVSDVEWAAAQTEMAAVVCACGAHGVDDPDQAATIVARWRDRWSRPTGRQAKVVG
jgi:hypothetical protein